MLVFEGIPNGRERVAPFFGLSIRKQHAPFEAIPDGRDGVAPFFRFEKLA